LDPFSKKFSALCVAASMSIFRLQGKASTRIVCKGISTGPAWIYHLHFHLGTANCKTFSAFHPISKRRVLSTFVRIKQLERPTTPTTTSKRGFSSTKIGTIGMSDKGLMTPEQRLLAVLGSAKLPPPATAKANYVPYRRIGDLLYLSGHLPMAQDGITLQYTGVMTSTDDDTSTSQTIAGGSVRTSVIEYGYEAAKQVGLNLLATISSAVDGDLSRVVQVVKLFGVVQSDASFHSQHLVVNGCSDLLVQVFGPDIGSHARSAVGTNALPLNALVEIEAIVQIRD
jgi:enamine deaminase RidA (YjgF/YER057c/UK114 family)